MKVEKLENLGNKIVLKGSKQSSLNAQGTQWLDSHSGWGNSIILLSASPPLG